MDRRRLLLLGFASPLTAFSGRSLASSLPSRTRWIVSTSEGLDALCFLGPLGGDPFYARYYPAELAAFRPKLDPATLARIADLHVAAKTQGKLLGPTLCLIFSGGPDETLIAIAASLQQAEHVLRPRFEASAYWSESTWADFLNMRPALTLVLADLIKADFAGFWPSYVDPRAAVRLPQVRTKLAGLDVIAEDERLTGRRFPNPSIEVDLLYFSQPHGIRIQGQRFLTHIDYPDEIVIRNAVHELLHPPFDAKSSQIQTVLAALQLDPLLTRIVAEHDPRFGYNSLGSLLEEDTVQALEQIANERLGVAVSPPRRWDGHNDDGMHVLAAALYGLLKKDGYDRTGGDIQDWLYVGVRTGKLAATSLHASAAEVLGRPADRLWPAPRQGRQASGLLRRSTSTSLT